MIFCNLAVSKQKLRPSKQQEDGRPLYATRNELHLKQKRYEKEYNSLRALHNRDILFL